MLVTQTKPEQEILENLKGEKAVFLLGCGGCAEICSTGGTQETSRLKDVLEKNGKKVTGSVVVDFLCNKALVASRLNRHADKLSDSDSILVSSCGIGVQAVSKIIDVTTHPAMNTLSRGGSPGLWPSEERCMQCGSCVLEYTGGVCPYSTCSKSLSNGPCGGSKDGDCEVEKGRPCGWLKIYDRLKAINKVGNLKRMNAARDFSKLWPGVEEKKTMLWAIDQETSEVKNDVETKG